MSAMVASASGKRQRETAQLSPSTIVVIFMAVLIVTSVFLTYRRAMITHNFVVIDDTEELEEEL